MRPLLADFDAMSLFEQQLSVFLIWVGTLFGVPDPRTDPTQPCLHETPHIIDLRYTVSIDMVDAVHINRIVFTAARIDDDDAASSGLASHIRSETNRVIGVDPNSPHRFSTVFVDGATGFYTNRSLGRERRMITMTLCPNWEGDPNICRNANIVFYGDEQPYHCDFNVALNTFMTYEGPQTQ